VSDFPRKPYAYVIGEIDPALMAAFSETRKGRIAFVMSVLEPFLDAFLAHIDENEVPLKGTLKVVITLHPPDEEGT
jgi:hypothetical protein